MRNGDLHSMERKLASLRTIKAIDDIVFKNTDGDLETAQNIVRVQIDGWQLVTQRSNNFRVGDLVVYFEIDSVLPSENPDFAFLEPYKYRLRTIKLKGQISQGLILPLSVIEQNDFYVGTNKEAEPEYIGYHGTDPYWKERDFGPFNPEWYLRDGLDVTEILGVTKYEPPIPACLSGKVKSNFPGFLTKTDEERVQNYTDVLETYKGVEFYATEKLDGTSFTCYRKDGVFGVCSRNLEMTETEDNTHWQVARKLGIEQLLIDQGLDNVCIQGELIGPGIQGNLYKLPEHKLYVFNFYAIEGREHFSPYQKNAKAHTNPLPGLDWVPLVWKGPLEFSLEELLAFAEGKSQLNPNQEREGLVFRPVVEVIDDPTLGRLSFKAISNRFLLKHE